MSTLPTIPLLLWAVTATARAEGVCGDDTTAVVDQDLEELWSAWGAVDEARLDRVGKNLTAAIACLDRVPSPVQVARLHQGMALLSFVNGQTRASRRSLAAARLMDPGWRLDDDAFPASHPFRDLFGQANDPGPVEEIGRISPDHWVVDGVVRDDAPVERAFLLQVQDEGGAIVFSEYLFDFEEVPDRGQDREQSPLTTPHLIWASLGLQGRVVRVDQRTEDLEALLDRGATAVGGGLGLQARFTPLSVLGAELSGSVASPADPVLRGGGQPSGQATLLVGGGGWVGGYQPFAAARVGVGVDQARAWAGVDEPPVAEAWTVVSSVFGVEGGVRSDALRAGLAADVLVAGGITPQQVRIRLDGGGVVTGPLALEGALLVAAGGQGLEDVDGRRIGSRSDTDVRAVFSVALWY